MNDTGGKRGDVWDTSWILPVTKGVLVRTAGGIFPCFISQGAFTRTTFHEEEWT